MLGFGTDVEIAGSWSGWLRISELEIPACVGCLSNRWHDFVLKLLGFWCFEFWGLRVEGGGPDYSEHSL